MPMMSSSRITSRSSPDTRTTLAGILAEQHAVTDFHVEREQSAVFENFAVADGENLALIRLFGSCIGDDDA